MKKIILLLLLPFSGLAQIKTEPLLPSIEAFAATSAVTGREEAAFNFIAQLFEKGICKKDKLGNLIITIGSGSPKRLFTAPLDEPGYVISQIQDDGYLRIVPVGYGFYGNLAHQFIEGNEIQISTEKNIQLGISTVPSQHYDRGGRLISERSKTPFQWQEAFIDVGCNSAKAVAAKGIQLLDPLTLHKKISIINNHFIAAPSVASKSAVIALAAVAKTLLKETFSGTVVIAFTTQELLNGKGLEAVVHQYGSFDEVMMFHRFLNDTISNEQSLLVDKMIPSIPIQQKLVKPTIALQYNATGQPEWKNAKVYAIGLPTKYPHTPVEMVSVNQVQQLMQAWLQSVQPKHWSIASLNINKPKQTTEVFSTFNKESSLVASLISKYGVNPQEKPVSDFILTQLPKWAKPTVDEKGNILLRFGKGKQHIAFVAHVDEVGYVVDSIKDDGTLLLKVKGGAFDWVWEGHVAIVHALNKEINAVFEPREDYLKSTKRFNSGIPLSINAGFHSKQEAALSGVIEGVTTVTMPKKMIRLSENKATARSFDDRVGCAALLLALENINPDALPFTVTCIWSVGEEIGLVGSTYASKSLTDVSMVYPIDTYVSSDAPTESKQFGYCPLGNGAVIRVLESANFVGRNHLHYLQQLATKNKIKTQYGMTIGGTDGQGFLSYGIPSVPLSWPGRYSHSPVEVMDFNDMHSLVQLIQSIMNDASKKY